MPDIIYLTPDANIAALYETFYHKWHHRLRRLVKNEVPHFDEGLALDFCQQAWTEVWQGILKKTYTYLTPGLLATKALSRIKDHHRRRARLHKQDWSQYYNVLGLDIDVAINCRNAVAALPGNERDVIEMLFWDGLTQDEIRAAGYKQQDRSPQARFGAQASPRIAVRGGCRTCTYACHRADQCLSKAAYIRPRSTPGSDEELLGRLQ